MYAIVKTGGKQYKVAAGDVICVEKLAAEVGDSVELPVICTVADGKIVADPAEAAKTTVTAEVLEQFKDKKKIVFKFKKRKNYKRLNGHRQQLTRVRITAIGAEKVEAPAEVAEPAAEDAE